jgi:transaldolase
MNKIQLYADGLNLEDFNLDYSIEIDGYTFNPSLFKKNGAKDYLEYSKKILDQSKNKPVSLEVFADEEKDMIIQAKILSKLGENVYVKIPITFTNQQSTINVIQNLVDSKIKMNITAIFTADQIKKILPIIKDTQTILSIFAGRIFDCGVDAIELMKSINKMVHKKSKCKTLWASPRMSYDYINAISTGTDIITMQKGQIEKLKMFNKKLEDYSLETIKTFYEDAKSCGYKL